MGIVKFKLSTGFYLVRIAEIDFEMICGCPADAVKTLAKGGFIREIRPGHDTGPKAILLSELPVQNGDISNLCEFPILHMLYKQGLLIPGHPGNTGQKPIVIGSNRELIAQLDYAYRGNYGLNTLQEILESGVDEETAKLMWDIKLFFAFGKISTLDNLIESYELTQSLSIPNGVGIVRKDLNLFDISYKGETVEVNLNLLVSEKYEPAVYLPKNAHDESYFSVIHSGVGDGWDVNRPCMSSIISYRGDFYLVDAGPNLSANLEALGISLADIKGVFMTHAHDDHFAGLCALFISPIRINFYATPWVKRSVSEKLCSLLSIEFDQLSHIFNIRDLRSETWNDLGGLEVLPSYSPHPIETSTMEFRVLWQGGYRSYTHLADISSFAVIDKMVDQKAITKKTADHFKSVYLKPAMVKKVDVGGGMIHGESIDFAQDKSKKLILSHISRKLTPDEMTASSESTFGSVDVLISGKDNTYKKIRSALAKYFPAIDKDAFEPFTHCDWLTLNSDEIITTDRNNQDYVYLLLTGLCERIDQDAGRLPQKLLSGSLLGFFGLLAVEGKYTYRTKSFAKLLKIPSEIFISFTSRYSLDDYLVSLHNRLELLNNYGLFSHFAPSIHFKEIVSSLRITKFPKNQPISSQGGIILIESGRIETLDEIRGKGEFCFEGNILSGEKQTATALEDSEGYYLSKSLIEKIPYLYWQVFEQYTKCRALAKPTKTKLSA